MPVLFTNNASTTLSAGINNSTTTIPIASASGFPSLSSGQYYFGTISNTNNTKIEIVKVASGTTSLTVTRGQDGTSAQAFDSGDNFQLRVTAATLSAVSVTDVAVTGGTVSADTLVAKGDGASADGQIQLNCRDNSHGIKLKSPPHSASANYTLTFPNDDGDANQKLTTNGSGVLTWTADTDTVYTHPNHSGDVTSSADGAQTIAADAVTGAKIADNAINSEHYTDGSIDHVHLAADCIDGDNIGDDVINSEHIVADSIDAEHLAPNSVNTDAIIDDSVTSAHIAAGAVDATALGADAVTAAKIGDDVINSEHIAAGAVDAEHMSANSIDSAQYVDGSIDTAHIADSQITQGKMAANAVTTAVIADAQVTGAKLALDHRSANATDDVKTGNQHDYIFFDADVGISFFSANAEDMRLTDAGALHVDDDVIAFSTTISDERLKDNIQPIEDALSKVNQLRGVTFTYISDGRDSAGLIAQDVEKVLPSAVKESELPLQMDDGKEYKILQYDQTIGLLVESIKELTAKVEKLEKK